MKTETTVILEDGSKISIPKDVLTKILDAYYENKKLKELNEFIKKSEVKKSEIAEKLGIRRVTFSQMLSGFIRSTKEVGSTNDFIEKTVKIINEVC